MEIARIEIPEHIRKVQMSAKQRAVYYEWNGLTIKAKRGLNLPRAFHRNKLEYPKNVMIEDLRSCYCIAIINDKGKVIDYIKENKRLPSATSLHIKYKYVLHYQGKDQKWEPVVANIKTVGTPSMYLINGQDIYNGGLKEFGLGKVIGAIKECYKPYIKDLPVITEYPIDIVCEIHDTIRNSYARSNNQIGGRWDIDNYAYPYLKAFPDLLVAEGKIRDDDRLHIPGTIHTIFCPIKDHNKRKLVFIISQTTRKEIVENEIYVAYHKNPETFESEDLDLVKEDNGFTKMSKKNKIQSIDLFNQDKNEEI